MAASHGFLLQLACIIASAPLIISALASGSFWPAMFVPVAIVATIKGYLKSASSVAAY